MNQHNLPAENLRDYDGLGRVHNDDALANLHMLRPCRELEGRKDRVVRLGGRLVLYEFADIVISPRSAVLAVINDSAALPAVVHDRVDDVGARHSLAHAFDPVVVKFGPERIEELDLGPLTQLLGCPLLKL